MPTPKSSLRPEILNPLFAKTTALKGIGPRLAKLVDKLVGEKIVGLLWHLPAGLIDRRFSPKVGDAPPNEVVTLTVEVLAHSPPPPGNRRVPYRITCGDDTGRIVLVFFHAQGDYLENTLPIGETRVISGKVELFDGRRQMTHPDHIVEVKDIASVQRVEPVYPLTAGLSGKVLDKAVKGALDRAPKLPEWLDPAFKKQRQWPDWRDALAAAHNPGSEAELSALTPARSRLAYDELLSNQLALSLVRLKARKRRGRQISGDGKLRAKVIAGLPYKLTGAQARTLSEIEADMRSAYRMLRLLQGDVGSGKTLVALMAMLIAVEAGSQAALMAPTELLAHQHYENLKPLAALAGV
ncbi:MAG: DEAD/DEAH box helicase, partial [Rhodospirillaceae bacterium]|nr:DEAD/DEAH box helicase [Rhodospirillaceae bacterium]